MADIVDEFVGAPSYEVLEQCSKEQLLKLAQHYGVAVDARRTKDTIKSILKANLQEEGVLKTEDGKSDIFTSASALTFEQQKELLLLKLEHEKQLEKMKYKMEEMKLEIEQQKLGLIKTGALPADTGEGAVAAHFDVTKNLRLVPHFDERDVDTFFVLFECVADVGQRIAKFTLR